MKEPILLSALLALCVPALAGNQGSIMGGNSQGGGHHGVPGP